MIVRWVGDAITAAAALEALGFPSLCEVEDGVVERMLKVPMGRVERVRAAIADEGGRVLEGAPASIF